MCRVRTESPSCPITNVLITFLLADRPLLIVFSVLKNGNSSVTFVCYGSVSETSVDH